MDTHEAPEVEKLKTEVQALRKQLRSEKDRLRRVLANLQLTKQQVEFFTQETHRASEATKDACWRFTKDACSELARVKSPSPALLDTCEKFLLILEQHDRSWKSFRAMCHNYNPLKALMNNASPDLFTEEQMSVLLPVWKNQQVIVSKLEKVSKGGVILAEWISACVEYRLRKETLLAAQHKLPDLDRRLKSQLQLIAELNAAILVHEERIQETQAATSATPESTTSLRGLHLDTSLASNASAAANYRHTEDRSVCIAPLPHGKATGGVVFQMTPRASHKRAGVFPNFASGELYRDTPELVREGPSIELENETELVGCCRSRFLCY